MSRRQAFEMLERRFGALSDLIEPRPYHRIVESSSGSLERAHLEQLFSHQCAAVLVPGFVDPAAAAQLARALVARDQQRQADAASGGGGKGGGGNWTVATGRGMESSDVRSVGGTPFALAFDQAQQGDPDALPRYFDEASAEIKWMRSCPGTGGGGPGGPGAFGRGWSWLPPLDKLRLELDEEWPGGASLLKDPKTGRPFLPGVGRVMVSSSHTHSPTQASDPPPRLPSVRSPHTQQHAKASTPSNNPLFNCFPWVRALRIAHCSPISLFASRSRGRRVGRRASRTWTSWPRSSPAAPGSSAPTSTCRRHPLGGSSTSGPSPGESAGTSTGTPRRSRF
mmetsp:Transcript_3352/g.7748  ORF Transcript_3352/g.7748 Transcript_3352/m.7748 type:complete len:338 (-) Transcript_3352:248-1261(-)